MSGLYGQEHVPVGEELILLPPHAAPLCVTGAEPSALTLKYSPALSCAAKSWTERWIQIAVAGTA